MLNAPQQMVYLFLTHYHLKNMYGSGSKLIVTYTSIVHQISVLSGSFSYLRKKRIPSNNQFIAEYKNEI